WLLAGLPLLHRLGQGFNRGTDAGLAIQALRSHQPKAVNINPQALSAIGYRLFDAPLIDKSTIGGAQVFYTEAAAFSGEFSVAAREVGTGDNDVALGSPADNDRLIPGNLKTFIGQPAAVGHQAPRRRFAAADRLRTGAMGIEDFNFYRPQPDNITGKDFLLGDSLTIDETAALAVVVFKKNLVLAADEARMQRIHAFIVQYQVIVRSTADAIKLLDHPQRGVAIVLEMNFQHLAVRTITLGGMEVGALYKRYFLLKQ